MIKRLFVTLLASAAVSTVVLVPAASAVTANNYGQALEIAPPVVNLSGDPGQTITTSLSLRNISNGSLTINSQVNDFTADGETGLPKLLLDSNTNSPYSLRDWLKPVPVLVLNKQQTKTIQAVLTIPKNASPGGYYGVIRFTGTPSGLNGSGVSLSASLGSLVFVKVNGKANEQMSFADFFVTTGTKPEWLFESTPVTFIERLKNTGNMFEQPVGQITITDMFHKKVAAVNVNLETKSVLPSSTRQFTEPLDSTILGTTRLFGHYIATINLKYGANGQTLTKTIDFWVIPYRLIIGGIITVIILFFIFRILIRRYNHYIIKKSQK